MTKRVRVGTMDVDERLHRFVEQEALPGSQVESVAFWAGVEALLRDFGPRNRELLQRREELQTSLDEYHRESPGRPADPAAYEQFLTELGYLVDVPAPFEITTANVDPEIAVQAGPQLIVPLLNARFATNAANARWGSLYDALYGADVIDEAEGRERGTGYNPARGAVVVARARAFLDEHLPLAGGSHAHVTDYTVGGGGLVATIDGTPHGLADLAAFVGYQGEPSSPSAVLLVHHGLHVEIQVDRENSIGATDAAGVKDVVLEAAVTTIMDLEDSVAAVDAEDKVLGYRNWLQLMQGTLREEVSKGGRTFTRTLNPDRVYRTPDGGEITLPGRAVLFIREVGHLMMTDVILDAEGHPVPEGLLDALLCGLGSVHDLRGTGELHNSRTGSIYVVKPKMHGPEEVAFTIEVFERVEEVLGLPPLTIKIGIMDEERRTSANLAACIHAARDRVAFINTGFLDRTGDEMHTSMRAGTMVRKADMRSQPWISAYEDNNVDVGLGSGFRGRAQIGKGMWAAPDNLADMLEQKVGHPLSGASCAWVPSPTAATLHALHYHQIDVAKRQAELAGRAPADRGALLTIPLVDASTLTAPDVQAELDNNVQGILGYVVRWVNAGVGCSKVPDLGGTPLMEDRATCRISSQHVANWLQHGILSTQQVEDALRRIAAIVDDQNGGDPGYRPMAPTFDGSAFAAARELIFDGLNQPSGYTEPILHAYRRARKDALATAEGTVS
ncbi:MAG: malate synthase G [Pseudonocardiales bacterium]